MNLEILVAIIAYMVLVWAILRIIGTFIWFKALTEYAKRRCTIDLTVEIITISFAIAYLIVYHS